MTFEGPRNRPRIDDVFPGGAGREVTGAGAPRGEVEETDPDERSEPSSAGGSSGIASRLRGIDAGGPGVGRGRVCAVRAGFVPSGAAAGRPGRAFALVADVLGAIRRTPGREGAGAVTPGITSRE